MTSNIISALGAGSGVDIKALAESLVEAEKAPRKERLDARIAASQARISGLGAIKYALGELKSAFEKLNDASDFSSIKVNNSQPSVLSLSTTSLAATGLYDIDIQQLAQGQRTPSLLFQSSTSSINGGQPMKLVLSGGNMSDVTVNLENPTPARLVSAINATKSGISAQLINTGSGHQIVLTGKDGQSSHFTATAFRTLAAQTVQQDELALTVSADPLATQVTAAYDDPESGEEVILTLEKNEQGQWVSPEGSVLPPAKTPWRLTVNPAETQFELFTANLQDAKDARLSINGVTITRAANSINDVLDGVSFNLLTTTEGPPARVDLSRDSAAIKSSLQGLVTAYKDLEEALKVLGDRDSDVEQFGGALAGDSLLQSIRMQMRDLLTKESSTPGTQIKAARDVGLSFDRFGNLQLDEARLEQALQDNFDQVVLMFSANTNNQSVFSAAPAGLAGNAVKRLDAMLRSTGIIELQTRNTNQQVLRLQGEMLQLDDRMSRLMTRYLQQFSVMESLVGNSNATREGLKSRFDGMMAMYTNR